MNYYDQDLSGAGDWVRRFVAGAAAPHRAVAGAAKAGTKMATRSATEQARKLVMLLQDAVKSWKAADRIRASLPRKFASRIPSSRLWAVKRIIGQLMRAGAVLPRGQEVQGLGIAVATVAVISVGAFALVGTAAAVAAVVAMTAKIVKEQRLAKDAKQKAELTLSAWEQEQRDAAIVGPERAAELARQRLAAAAGLFSAETPSAAVDVGIGVKLPWWVLPAGIAAGAAILFGGQTYAKGRR